LNKPEVVSFFDQTTFTVTHVVIDPQTRACAVVDPVLDYDPDSGRTSTHAVDKVISYITTHNLSLEWVLETHIHADHLTAAPLLTKQLGGKSAIGSKVKQVQRIFSNAFNITENFACDGSDFDQLFEDGETFTVGKLEARAIHTPGHTPACMTYVIDDAAFAGDTLFMPDFGSARCDFPGGDAAVLYESIQKVFSLPDETRLFMCHDYKAPGRNEYQWETTVAEQKQKNIHVGHGRSKQDFVSMRNHRDSELSLPQLILPSVQVNMRAGHMPPPESNGKRYLKIPINVF
jgi:glyoxylase-like metal-dependent hydrolase (beta-lactamase superfamily II)